MKSYLIVFLIILLPNRQLGAQQSRDTMSGNREVSELLASSQSAFESRDFEQAELLADSALQAAESIGTDSTRAKCYLWKGKMDYLTGKYTTGDSLAQIALSLFEKKSDKTEAWLIRIYCTNYRGELQDALPLFREAEKDFDESVSNDALFDFYLMYALYYYDKDEHFKHLEYLFKMRRFLTKDSSSDRKSSANYYLGVAYENLGDYKYSNQLFWSDILYNLKEAPVRDLQYSYFGLLENYYHLEEYDSVKYIGHLSLNLAEKHNFSASIGFTYSLIGAAYLKENKLDSAEYYFFKGVELSQKQNEPDEVANNYLGLVQLALQKNDTDEALKYADLYKKTGYTGDDEINYILADVYAKRQDFAKAYEYLSESWNLEKKEEPYKFSNDLVLGIFKEKEENEREIAQQKIEQAEQRRKNQLLISSLISLVALTIGIAGIALYRQTQKRNELLRRDLANKKLIEAQAAELRKTEALKSRLFANFSHELRTPITLVRNPIKQLLSKHKFNEQVTSILEDVLLSSEELLVLSDQILELNRAEVNDLEVNVNDFKLNDLFAYLRRKFAGLAQRKDIVIKIPDLSALDISLKTDAKKTEVILRNLLSNALKYSESKSEISITCADLGENVEIRVEDEGRGITKEDLARIFDRYYQAKHDSIIPEGGVGIGLAVSKEYSQLMGGGIRAESKAGIGSAFILTLPKQLKGSETVISSNFVFQAASLPDSIIATPSKVSNHILIVEDNLKLSRHLREILEIDYDVRMVYNGREALRSMEKERPSLILTDLMMPIMGGMELIERIKQNEEWSEIPVVVLTAKNGVLDELKALRVGIDDYILKPFEPEQLEATVYNLINYAESRQTAREDQTEFNVSKIKTSIESKEMNKRDKIWLRKVEEQIDELATDPNLNLDTLARNLSVSRTLLNTRMKELTGLTPKRYVNEVRLLKSRRLLESKEYYSVKSVAYSVGFNSEKLFSRSFKSRFGMYPSEYMKEV